jgi:beta-galactosidase
MARDNRPIIFPSVLHGGDYNPDQWPRDVWDEDVRLMNAAHVNVATLPVFSWVTLQPSEDVYDFEWLDDILQRLERGGIRICMATPTASMPSWLNQKYPEASLVEFNGVRRKIGNRQMNCPNNPDFRRLACNITRRLAERYKDNSNILLWHISNEYGSHCYCDTCAEQFRIWLETRYGSLTAVNEAWNTRFWGQWYSDWTQIEPPSVNGNLCLLGMRLDYDRFQDRSVIDLYRAEAEIVREITPNLPVTTNMMGAHKGTDYVAWAKEVDIVSWDSYPKWDDPASTVAFNHSLMRGLKDGKPWMLMEQTPSVQNWSPYCTLKAPGVLRKEAFQAVAHGAEAIMYFQWRRSRGAAEKMHGAVVGHDGSGETRVFREVAALGKDLESLGQQTLGGIVQADVAILFDWENWWAVEYSSGPSQDLRYLDQVIAWYTAFYESGVTADVISPDADLGRYKLVVAPLLYLVRESTAANLEKWTAAGGRFVGTFFSGIVDESDLVTQTGYPGLLRKLLGILVEEVDARPASRPNSVVFDPQLKNVPSESEARLLCDLIYPEGAEVLARYNDDFYSGVAAITANNFGLGTAYYVGTALAPEALQKFSAHLAKVSGALPVLPKVAPGVESLIRLSANGTRLLYLINHKGDPAEVTLPMGNYKELLTNVVYSRSIRLNHFGVAVLQKTDEEL